MRHRLSRAGNRRINHALYMAGIVQLPDDTAGRGYRRLLADGKTPTEAMRCPRRRLSDVAWRQLAADAARKQAGPGGHSEAFVKSSAADLTRSSALHCEHVTVFLCLRTHLATGFWPSR